MHIGYLISAHTDPQQLKRLVDAINSDRACFFIHIDRKVSIEQFTSVIKGGNIRFIQDRKDVRWGTIIETDYQMALIRAAAASRMNFDKLFFLSGMDYPLWSTRRIEEWVDSVGGKEVLYGINMNTCSICGQQRELYATPRPFFSWKWLGNKGNQRLGILCRKLKKAVGLRKPLAFAVDGQPWNLYKGSAWCCISGEMASDILKVYDTVPAVKRYFTDSFGPAETVIPTIAFNNRQWASKCTLVEGAYPGLAALTPLHFIDYNPVIKVMDEADYGRLVDSGRMFARKLVSGKSDKLVEMLDEHRRKEEERYGSR